VLAWGVGILVVPLVGQGGPWVLLDGHGHALGQEREVRRYGTQAVVVQAKVLEVLRRTARGKQRRASKQESETQRHYMQASGHKRIGQQWAIGGKIL
jgi:hypothetical protein